MPTVTDIERALKRWPRCPPLKREAGLLAQWQGSFAVVFATSDDTRRLRFPWKDAGASAEHYASLKHFVGRHDALSKYLVEFDYRRAVLTMADGALVDCLEMTTAPGQGLKDILLEPMRHGDLTWLLEAWADMAEVLGRLSFAHGDLQPGNIFVDPKSRTVTLVDYDSAVFPANAGMQQTVAGMKGYQHHFRMSKEAGWTTRHLRCDAISHAVILAAIFCAIHHPSWSREYGVTDTGKDLLFGPEPISALDVNGPAWSSLLQTLPRLAPVHHFLRVALAARTPDDIPAIEPVAWELVGRVRPREQLEKTNSLGGVTSDLNSIGLGSIVALAGCILSVALLSTGIIVGAAVTSFLAQRVVQAEPGPSVANGDPADASDARILVPPGGGDAGFDEHASLDDASATETQPTNGAAKEIAAGHQAPQHSKVTASQTSIREPDLVLSLEPMEQGACFSANLASFEMPALGGKLTPEQLECLMSDAMDVDRRVTERERIGRIILVNEMARCATGACEGYENFQIYYFSEIDRSDPEMLLAWSKHLWSNPEADVTSLRNVVVWAGRALERKQGWESSIFRDRVAAALRLRALAAYDIWLTLLRAPTTEMPQAGARRRSSRRSVGDTNVTLPGDVTAEAEAETEDARLQAKEYVREWLAFVTSADLAREEAASICRDIVGSSVGCE